MLLSCVSLWSHIQRSSHASSFVLGASWPYYSDRIHIAPLHEVAANELSLTHIAQDRLYVDAFGRPAQTLPQWTARLETATIRRVRGRRNLSAQGRIASGSLFCWIGNVDRGQ